MQQQQSNMGTILLVEDDEFVREVVWEILDTAGYDVLKAQNAQEALDIAGTCNNKIDLLFSDVVMPGKTGPELGVELRKVRPEIKLLFTSGYGDSANEANRSGVDGEYYLPKPFSVGALVGKVREALASQTGTFSANVN